MPIASGIYIITNVKQRNPIFLENPNDEESIRGHYKPDSASEQTQQQWHWRVTDLNNGLHSIQNVKHQRYAYSGSRAGLNASVMGASEEQQWHIQAISGKGEYTVGAIDSPNFWMLPDKGKRTPVELFDVPTDRTCWWVFTNVETGAPVKEDAAYGAYLFALKPLPILPFSPLRLDFVIIQQMPEDSISNASRTIAGVCGRLVSLGRVRSDSICVNVIEVTSVGSDIFFERSYDVVAFEKLRNLGVPDVLWEECDGASTLPAMAIRGLRKNTTKVAILNFGDALFQQGGEAIMKLINDLAEHDITLVLTPIHPTWEHAFSDSVVSKELRKLSSEYRRFRQESQFSDYLVNYIKTVALPRLKKHPELRHEICSNIPHIIEVLKDKDQNTRSAAVAAVLQLADYTELRIAILKTILKIVGMLEGNSDEAEAAASALIKLAEHAQLCHAIDLNTPGEDGLTPLLRAACNGNEPMIRLLLAHEGVNVDAKDKNGRTSLLWAAVNEHEAVVGLLLAHPGVDVNAKDKDGWTPLLFAAAHGHDAVVRLMLAHPGVDVNAKDKNGRTSLLWEAVNEHESMVGLLLAQASVDVNAKDKNGRTPLSMAASKGHNTVVRLLLAHPGVDVNAKDEVGSTPLLFAAASGHDAVVGSLLAHPGVDINAKGNDGRTPLLFAASHGHGAVVGLLLAYPALDINAKDKDGWTPLLFAAAHGHDAVVHMMLACPGVDINGKNNDGSTPLLFAAAHGHNAVVRLMLAHPGINVNAKGLTGRTPLTCAAMCGWDAVVRLLLAHPGIDVNAMDNEGRTPLSYATRKGHHDVVRLLREKIQQISIAGGNASN